MPRLVFKCSYLAPNKPGDRGNYAIYLATRDGVEVVPNESRDLTPSNKQRELIEKILIDFPSAKESLEYEEYIANPTISNASEFLTNAIEENRSSVKGRDGYVTYISERKRTARVGEHGLFSSHDGPVVLSRVADEIRNHPGNVWTPIISLQRDDAVRLHYDNAETWRALLRSHADTFAKWLKIPPNDFVWYAAYHDEGHHPHVHMVCYSRNPRQGYLTKDGIREIRASITKDIFRHDLDEIYRDQTLHRNEVNTSSLDALKEMISAMSDSVVDNREIMLRMEELSNRLRFHKGKMVYGYLRPPVKALVNSIVDELADEPHVAAAYEKWCIARQEIISSYKDTPESTVPLSQNKEFKSVRNMVVKEAARLLHGDFTIEHAAGLSSGQRVNDTIGSEHDEVDNENVPVDMEKLISEAEKGNDNASYRLGKLFLTGECVQKNAAEGLRWMTLAAKSGNQHAQYALGKFLLFGDEGLHDVNAAVHWLESSASQGNIYASFLLQQREQWKYGSVVMAGTRMLGGFAQIIASTPPYPPLGAVSPHLDQKRRRELQQKKGGKIMQQQIEQKQNQTL
ncbi:relaxase MobL [Ruminococcaceae bacterium OttesenSCG-928-I18]|nr:relaxase MobL [Ruminococcaceae bacterium OttesenSCG-928-I18]